MKAILNERFWLRHTEAREEVARELYQFKTYDEKSCDRCEFRPERHCDVCSDCPAFLGETALWKTMERGDTTWIGVPRGNRAKLKKFVDGDRITIVDRRGNDRMRTPLKFTGKLRDNQKEPIRDAIAAGYGVLKAPPRAGKTVMAAAIACRMGYKTLILAAQQEWLDEFYRTFMGNDSIPAMTNAPEIAQFESMAIVGQCKTVDDFARHDVCLATYQTFITPGGRKKLAKIKSMFGLIIIDEVHGTAATAYARVLLGFNARHMIGLTGTDDRKDGLYCQPAGTQVLTSTGDKNIESIVIGDTVIGFNHLTNTLENNVVTNTIVRPPTEIYEVQHQLGTIRATGDHQVWSVTRNAYVKVRDLQSTDVFLAVSDPPK